MDKHYPEDNDGILDCGALAQSCAFNRFGTLLAVGCRDGRIVLWDLSTKGITRTFSAHSYSVTTLSWSRSGRFLASGAKDGTVYIWDVMSGERHHAYHFVAPLVKVQFHPRCDKQLLACASKQRPIVVDIAANDSWPVPDGGENIIASYSRRGEYIVTGNSRGMVSVFQTDTLKELVSVRVPTSAMTQIKSIEFCSRRSLFLVSSADRIIRLFDTDTLPGGSNAQDEPACIQRMQDLVNRTMWKNCHFSGDGTYVVAGCSREHYLHLYETSTGSLMKVLKGSTGEDLTDMAWHPLRPTIVSVCSGTVTLWTHHPVENWSAFAPNFTELEENEEYDERESEFDQEDEDRSEKGDIDNDNGEDLEVDVVAVDSVPHYVSSDEEESSDLLLNLPVQLDFDDDTDDGEEEDEEDEEEAEEEEEEEEEERGLCQVKSNQSCSLKRKIPDEAVDENGRPKKQLKTLEITGKGTPLKDPPAPVPSTPAFAHDLGLDPLPVTSTEMNILADIAGPLPDVSADVLPVPGSDLSLLLSDLLESGDAVTADFQLPPVPTRALREFPLPPATAAAVRAEGPPLSFSDYLP